MEGMQQCSRCGNGLPSEEHVGERGPKVIASPDRNDPEAENDPPSYVLCKPCVWIRDMEEVEKATVDLLTTLKESRDEHGQSKPVTGDWLLRFREAEKKLTALVFG